MVFQIIRDKKSHVLGQEFKQAMEPVLPSPSIYFAAFSSGIAGLELPYVGDPHPV